MGHLVQLSLPLPLEPTPPVTGKELKLHLNLFLILKEKYSDHIRNEKNLAAKILSQRLMQFFKKVKKTATGFYAESTMGREMFVFSAFEISVALDQNLQI